MAAGPRKGSKRTPKHKPKSGSKAARVLATVAEHGAVGASAIVGGASYGPPGALAAGTMAKGAITWIREQVSSRASRRAAAFEEELSRALEKNDPKELEKLAGSDSFPEAVYQAYRRAMDAVDVSVAPALARLAAAYHGRPVDGFFRGLGRVLEDLSSDEFECLRQIVGLVADMDAEAVNVYPWLARSRRIELRFEKYGEERGDVQGADTFSDAARVLSLVEANGLKFERVGAGMDLAARGRTALSPVTCGRIREIIGPSENHVVLRPATFDRPE